MDTNSTTLKDYNETYAHKMRDQTYLDAYLGACLSESPEALCVGLRRAVQAREGGFTWLSKKTGLGRESLYRALRADGNPSFRTIYKVLTALGADVDILTGTRNGNGEGTESARARRRGRSTSRKQAAVSDVLAPA